MLVAVAGCSASSPGPKGWQPKPGASAAWVTGAGANEQEYSYGKRQFSGGLQDLASRVTIDALMRNRGARFQHSAPFGPCPGAAGVATFLLPGARTLQEAFAVHDGQAIQITYARPIQLPADSAAISAMQNALCTL
jgi:hypothetical protein